MTASDGCEVKLLKEAERSYPGSKPHSSAVKDSGSAGLLLLKEKPVVTYTQV